MPLPDSCEPTDSHLVFWELMPRALSTEHDRLYEYCCGIACTNHYVPAGELEVHVEPIPSPSEDRILVWGTRHLDPESARAFAAQGYVLCRLSLPVKVMGAPGAATIRPPGT